MLLLAVVAVFQGSLLLVKGEGWEEVFSWKRPQAVSAFRWGRKWAVWDKRGLAVRSGGRVRSFWLEDCALSPKLFSIEDILANKERIRLGKISKRPAALMGSAMHKQHTYWAFSWRAQDGKEWLSALILVDLSHEFPKPELVSRIAMNRVEGMRVFGDSLALTGGVAREGWGLARFHWKDASWDQIRLAGAPAISTGLSNGSLWYALGAGNGADIYSHSLLNGRSKFWASAPSGKVSFLAGPSAMFALWPHGAQWELRNLQNGSECWFSAQNPVCTTGKNGIAVFDMGKSEPTRAFVFDPVLLYKIAEAPFTISPPK